MRRNASGMFEFALTAKMERKLMMLLMPPGRTSYEKLPPAFTTCFSSTCCVSLVQTRLGSSLTLVHCSFLRLPSETLYMKGLNIYYWIRKLCPAARLQIRSQAMQLQVPARDVEIPLDEVSAWAKDERLAICIYLAYLTIIVYDSRTLLKSYFSFLHFCLSSTSSLHAR